MSFFVWRHGQRRHDHRPFARGRRGPSPLVSYGRHLGRFAAGRKASAWLTCRSTAIAIAAAIGSRGTPRAVLTLVITTTLRAHGHAGDPGSSMSGNIFCTPLWRRGHPARAPSSGLRSLRRLPLTKSLRQVPSGNSWRRKPPPAHDHAGLVAKDVRSRHAGPRRAYQQSVIDAAITRPAAVKLSPRSGLPADIRDRASHCRRRRVLPRQRAALLKRIETEFGVPAELIATILGCGDQLRPRHWSLSRARCTDDARLLLSATRRFFPQRTGAVVLAAQSFISLRRRRIDGPVRRRDGLGPVHAARAPRALPATEMAMEKWDMRIPRFLWNSLPDICASVANYFVAHGWQVEGRRADAARTRFRQGTRDRAASRP